MKFLTTLLLVVAGVTASAQTYIDFRKPMRLLYGGDTLIISLQGDSVIFSGKAAELVLRDTSLLELIKTHGGGSSYIGDEYLNLPGDGEGNNYLDIQLDRDNGGYLDFGWTSTDETSSASFNISPSGLSFSTYHDSTDWYYMNFNASDVKHTAIFSITTPYGTWGFMPTVYGPITDDTPTASEISTIIGVTPDYLPAGCRVTIKDTDGSGLMYMVESHGFDWYYTVMTKAL